MAHGSWFFLVYGVGLFYLLVNPSKVRVRGRGALRRAWFTYCAALFTVLLFTVLRASVRSPEALILVEIWAVGVSWACVALSAVFMLDAVIKPDVPQAATHRKKQMPQIPMPAAKANDRGDDGGEDES